MLCLSLKLYSYITFVQLTSLSKILAHDKAPNLRNLTVLPLRLSPEKDEELLRLTEGRIPTFAHDLVPDYLRTKLEPQAEQKMMQLEAKAANVNIDTSHVRHNSLCIHFFFLFDIFLYSFS